MSDRGFSTPRTDTEWKIVADPKVPEGEMHVNPAMLDRMQQHRQMIVRDLLVTALDSALREGIPVDLHVNPVMSAVPRIATVSQR